MNGDRTLVEVAESHARSAAQSAQRASVKAEAATNAVLEVHQALGGVLRELGDIHLEMRGGFSSTNRRLERLESNPVRGPKAASLPDLDSCEPSDTGNHMLVPADSLERLLNERAGKRVRTLALAVGTGAATLGGEQILRFFLALFGHHH